MLSHCSSCYFGDISYSSFLFAELFTVNDSEVTDCGAEYYSPIVFAFISVDVNGLAAGDYQLYLSSFRC